MTDSQLSYIIAVVNTECRWATINTEDIFCVFADYDPYASVPHMARVLPILALKRSETVKPGSLFLVSERAIDAAIKRLVKKDPFRALRYERGCLSPEDVNGIFLAATTGRLNLRIGKNYARATGRPTKNDK